ncbi:MAG: sigma factor-like helix-turn-helix DNA-binding protein [Finegoldia sp.]|nr:sigma factor-like helix-turn-helix DNA-binding protein [Finegoldia sp.]
MEKLLDITMMYDYYGNLLTERERDVIDKYYNEDLSLKEIADINGVSKQAVAASLKRAEKKLYDYEEKLALIKKSNKATFFLEKIYDDLSKVSQANDNKEISEILEEIRDFLNSLEDV